MFPPLRFAAAILLVGARAPAVEAQSGPIPVPPLTAHVTDLTGTLSEGERLSLETDLTALETRKGAQLAILIVPTTGTEDIAQFGIRVADAWKLGRKGTDDGVILLVAKDDHRVRIEVGRGLEGAIPDAMAARVIREYLSPRFRENDFAGGLRDAVGALTRLIDAEPLPPPLTDEPQGQGGAALGPALVAGWVSMLFLRRLFGRLPGLPRAGLVALGGGAVGWLVSGLAFVGIAIGVLGLIMGLGGGGGGGGGFARRGGWGGWGGFGGGGFGGGGFGGGRSGGGGFSGGGGGFAGGGASGRW